MKFFAALLLTPLLSAQILYVGTYTEPRSPAKGIYAYRFNAATGKLAPLGLMAPAPNPSFLALHPSGKYLYAVNEVNSFDGKSAGSLTAYAIDAATGRLKMLNQVSTGGPGPCHVSVDKTGKTVLVANYGGGSFTGFPILDNGAIGASTWFAKLQGSGPDKSRQEQPHGHSVNISGNNRFMLGADLGTDRVMIYRLDAANAKLTPDNPPFAEVKPGSGPRHLVFAPDQKHVYVLSEMAESVTTFDFNQGTGAMKRVDVVSALPADFKGTSTAAEIEIDAAGRFVYASNRGDDSISVFAVDPKSGTLKLVQTMKTGGRTPRAFMFDPTGKYLIVGNQDSNTITTFKVNQATGMLTATGDKLDLGAPVTFVFLK